MVQIGDETHQEVRDYQGAPIDHRVRRNLLLLMRVLLLVMLVVFSISSRNASAQDTQHQEIAPGLMPQSLQEKMHRLQALVERLQQQAADLQPVGELMQGLQPLMQEQKFGEAEALLDRALELANKLGSPAQTGVPPAQTGPPPSLQRKVHCLEAQVQKWQQEGKDPQPIVDIMQGIPRLIDEQKFAKAEKVVDRALEVAGEACPDAATSPAEVPPSAQAGPPRSLQQKVDCFQAIVEKWQQEGKDPQPLGDIMRDFPALMEQGKLAEAERVVDRALKASGEACRDQGAGQRLSAETNIANQTSPPSTPTSTAVIDPSSSGGGLGRRTFLISAMLPPPKGFDLPTAEDLLTQNGANFFMFSQDWDKIEPSSGHYDLTNTITNPFTLLIPKYRFKGVTLVLKMIDTNNRTMPADLKIKPFDDPQVEQRFLKMLHMVATAPGVASHVNYILLGNEVDSYFDAHPGELAGFMSLLKASIDQLHQDLPGVKVGTITTFSTLRHPELFRTLTQYSDFIDYTYYPLAAHWRMRPVSDVPGDLAKMSAAAGNKQFGFTEIGYSASPLSGSSDQQQADFMKTVFQTLDTFGKQVAFVDWASLGDTPPDLCEAYAKSQGLHDVDAMCAYGEHTGLRTYDNQPRPAWNIFVQAMKASGQSQ